MSMSRSLRDFLVSELPKFDEDTEYSIVAGWVQGGMVMYREVGPFARGTWINGLVEDIVSTLEQDLMVMAARSATAYVRIQSPRMVREHLLPITVVWSPTANDLDEPKKVRSVPTTRSVLLDAPRPVRRFSFDED